MNWSDEMFQKNLNKIFTIKYIMLQYFARNLLET